MTQRKNEKGVQEMTDGIGKIGASNYGFMGGYVPQRKGEEASQDPITYNNAADTQVDPSKVMDFMAANNYFVAPTESSRNSHRVDEATQARIEGYMANFEVIYDVIAREFGPESAPAVMDAVMDHLMGLVA